MRIKISEDELENGNETPLELFCQGIRADVTRDKYTRTLRKIVCEILEDLLQGDFEDRVSQFVKKAKADPECCKTKLRTKARGRSKDIH